VLQNFFQLIILTNQQNTVIKMIPFWSHMQHALVLVIDFYIYHNLTSWIVRNLS